jgi:hypothetical protein
VGFRYLMSRERAEEVAVEVRREHPEIAVAIDANAVRRYCVSEAQASEALNGEPGTPSWFENTSAAEVAARIHVERLLDTGMTED